MVRITAGEVRKRIALYYHDEGTGQELRIELPSGSYVPVFSEAAYVQVLQEAALPLPAPTLIAPSHPPPSSPAYALQPRPWMRIWGFVSGFALFLALAIAGIWFWAWNYSPVESMWHAFFGSPTRVLIVIGSPLGALAGDNASKLPLDSHSHVHLSFDDVLAHDYITGLLDLHQQRYRVQTASATSLDDLRKRPVVLISAFGNPWSGRILAPLRFSLLRQQIATDGSTILGSIVDRRHPGSMWNFDFTKPVTVNSKDYAIVARLHSDLTEGPVAVIAGLGATATESAGEFVSTPDYLQQIRAVAPTQWRNKNLELVLEIPVIDGKAGHARIVASEFW